MKVGWLNAEGGTAQTECQTSQPSKSGGKENATTLQNSASASGSLGTPPQVKSARSSPLSYSVVLSPEPHADASQRSAAVAQPSDASSGAELRASLPPLRTQVGISQQLNCQGCE